MVSGPPSDLPGKACARQDGPAIPGTTQAAFSLTFAEPLCLPLLIAVPHAGREYPADVLAAMRDPEGAAMRLEDRFADALGEEVARLTGAPLLVAHAPRAMLDLNRAPDDIDWGMVAGARARQTAHSFANRRARSGLGLVPRRLPGMGEIWKRSLTSGEVEERVETLHRPYHKAISQVLEAMRDRWGAAMLLDLHSMPPLKRGPGQACPADFVLGDRFGASCDPALCDLVLRQIGDSGRLIAHNRPYSGGYVLDCHAAPRRGIHALQLEVSRALYLDPRLDRPGPRMAAVARVLATVVQALAEEVVHIGDGRAWRQAAE